MFPNRQPVAVFSTVVVRQQSPPVLQSLIPVDHLILRHGIALRCRRRNKRSWRGSSRWAKEKAARSSSLIRRRGRRVPDGETFTHAKSPRSIRRLTVRTEQESCLAASLRVRSRMIAVSNRVEAQCRYFNPSWTAFHICERFLSQITRGLLPAGEHRFALESRVECRRREVVKKDLSMSCES